MIKQITEKSSSNEQSSPMSCVLYPYLNNGNFILVLKATTRFDLA